MSMQIRTVGSFAGRRVDAVALTSDTGHRVEVMNWGVTVRDWRVPVAGGERHVVLGFDDFEAYPANSPFFGSIIGRVANRIRGTGFVLDGVRYDLPANDGANHLHGGLEGLGRVVWDAEPDSAANAVRFRHVSPHGAMGYPGTVAFEAIYTLAGNRLRLELAAAPDRPTPVSLTQHHYFNLGSGADVLDHRLTIAAPAYTPADAQHCTTGAIVSVADTKFDVRAGRTLRDHAGRPLDYDVNLVLDQTRDPAAPAAMLVAPDDSLTLRLWTDRPGLQLYNAGWDTPTPTGLHGRRYARHAGLCLEDQAFPGALEHAHFPAITVTPDAPYRHRCQIEIG